MQIALASYECINNDTDFNLRQIERALQAAPGAALVCFGEAFLQGFDAFSWDYARDRGVAVAQDNEIFRNLRALSIKYNTGLAFGYLERAGEALYSSYAVILDGRLACNYRRLSRGWKEYRRTDEHYREGERVCSFSLGGHEITIALCGDLWDMPERFRSDDLVLWPVYCEYTPDEWQRSAGAEYASQASKVCPRVLMVNSICKAEGCYGGAFDFCRGHIAAALPHAHEALLLAEI